MTYRLSILAALLLLVYGVDWPVDQDANLAFTPIEWTFLAIAIGAAIFGGALLDKNTSPVSDSKPTTLTERGSFCNWWLGVRRVGPIISYAKDREVRQEAVEGGGKGLEEPEQDVYYEAGWHILGIGPIDCLYSIIQQGKTIFEGPISPESHPSGSTIDLGKEGSFRIFWGETTQPLNTFLGDSERVGATSRWPHIAYVEWNKKRLGTSPNWSIIDYVVERRPKNTQLTQSSGWYPPTQVLSGETFTIDAVLADADQDTGYLEVESNVIVNTKQQIELTGVGLPDGTYTVLRRTYERTLEPVGSSGGFARYRSVTRIFLEGGTLGATATGSAERYTVATDNGANPAHVIADCLFQPWPLGIGLDPTGPEPWDLESLEAFGVEAEAEGWRASVLATSGDSPAKVLGAVLQDFGIMLPLDVQTGELTFRRLREPVGAIPTVPAGLLGGKKPAFKSYLGPQKLNRVIYSFTDRDNGWSDQTFGLRDDGQAELENHARAELVGIRSTVHFDTASKIAEHRSGEDLSRKASFKLPLTREARELMPGDLFLLEGHNERLVVLSNRPAEGDPMSEACDTIVSPDFYSSPFTGFAHQRGAPVSAPVAPVPDLLANWIEVPEQVLGGLGQNEQVVLPLRVRANTSIANAVIHISGDDTTYTLKTSTTTVATGGRLLAEFPAGSRVEAEYTEHGPDNGTITQDLTGDTLNWSLGRQVCVIVSSAGVEICFLAQAEIVSAGVRRLKGLIRGRYDTRELTHPVGAEVYIFDSSRKEPIRDELLGIGTDLYLKYQPGTSGGQVPLDAAVPIGEVVSGKGQVPITPDYVHVRAPYRSVPAFEVGGDVTVSWGLSSGTVGTGAGAQVAGQAIGDPVIPGTVTVELLTAGDVVSATLEGDPSVGSLAITNAELVSAFGSEPTSFKVRVRHAANGQLSLYSPSLTIDRI